MTNVRTWQDRIRRELRNQWWQTITAILAIALGAGLWLAFNGDDGEGVRADEPLPACDQGADCRVLLSVQAQLEGTKTSALNWSADIPMKDWYGVELDANGRVQRLRPVYKGMDGTLPAALSQLTELTHLDFANNALTGSIPKEWGALAKLTTLSLTNNKLTGSIPPELGKATKLGAVYLTDNDLSGRVPAELGNARGLWALSMERNKLTGPLPATLTRLIVLRVKGNAFTCVPVAVRDSVFVHDLGNLRACTAADFATPTPTPTATTTPTATATATAEKTYTLTVTQAAHGSLVALPGPPYKWRENLVTLVTVTATADHGYELTAWGGDCASTPKTRTTCDLVMDADRSVTATFGRAKVPVVSGPLTLMVISKGDADALTLEWTGGPANASSWQYRTRMWVGSNAQSWGSWTNIPNSGALTASYRLTGLRVNGAYGAYEVQVRAVVGSTAGTASNVGRGVTHKKGSAPRIYPNQIVEGDGKTQWRVHELGWVITIPDGVRVRGGGVWASEDSGAGVILYDQKSGSSIAFDSGGFEVGRNIVTPAQGSQGQNDVINPQRDVGALFDQIVASVRQKR